MCIKNCKCTREKKDGNACIFTICATVVYKNNVIFEKKKLNKKAGQMVIILQILILFACSQAKFIPFF